MIDGFGRRIHYLRLSVIDRCDLRCRYCMADEPDFLPKEQVLSLEEMADLARIFIRLGVKKIRLTGGEPLMRRNVMPLVEVLGQEVAAGRLDELTMTTNGTQLAKYAGGPARYVTVAETGQRLGFITPMTHGFCESCNRMRLTCTGQLVACLGHETGTDLRSALRSGSPEKAVEQGIVTALGLKPHGHEFLSQLAAAHPLARTMNRVGG